MSDKPRTGVNLRCITLTALLRPAALFAMALALAGTARADSAEALRDKYQTLTSQLKYNAFNKPLVLSSVETPNKLSGEIHAVMAYPFDRLSSGLSSPTHWCDVMSLHINTKYCRATVTPTASKLIVRIGSKGPEELSRAARLEFEYSAPTVTQDYLSVALAAKAGPLGTSDYRITLEAVPLLDGRSFLRLRYSYAFGLMGKLAMQTYLATVGSDKVGFTVVAQRPDGEPEYIGGVRGVVERNTMRYYLAVDSFLESMPTPPAAQFEQRLHSWFAATERYARQLHEGNLEAYLAMKRAEQVREQEDD